ncbi:hypothetical protein GJ496_004414 [Pomphorhynchus laevis]|nr:hypothetical protein GJ496_004414 [Pomphorhynchus laevis]
MSTNDLVQTVHKSLCLISKISQSGLDNYIDYYEKKEQLLQERLLSYQYSNKQFKQKTRGLKGSLHCKNQQPQNSVDIDQSIDAQQKNNIKDTFTDVVKVRLRQMSVATDLYMNSILSTMDHFAMFHEIYTINELSPLKIEFIDDFHVSVRLKDVINNFMKVVLSIDYDKTKVTLSIHEDDVFGFYFTKLQSTHLKYDHINKSALNQMFQCYYDMCTESKCVAEIDRLRNEYNLRYNIEEGKLYLYQDSELTKPLAIYSLSPFDRGLQAKLIHVYDKEDLPAVPVPSDIPKFSDLQKLIEYTVKRFGEKKDYHSNDIRYNL